MDLAAALSSVAPQPSPVESHNTVFLNGSIEPDHDPNHIRLYQNPQNRRSFYLIRKVDVNPTVHEWTASELSQAGFVGARMFRISLAGGTPIHSVDIKIHKIGETVAGDDASGPRLSAATGTCYNTSCGTHPCCQVGSDGRCYCSDCCVA